MFHPKQACPSLSELKERLNERWGCATDAVVIYNWLTKYGGGRSSGTCLVYDNKDYKMKFEPDYRLRREKLIAEKDISKTRKTKKNIKVKVRKLRGKAKVKAMNS